MSFQHLHVANGIVWYSDTDGQPRNTGMTVAECLETPGIGEVDQVRLLGTRANAEFITGLFDLKGKGQIGSVQVCSPRACKTAEERDDPAIAMSRIRNFKYAPSLGGFHEVVENDRRAYTLSAATAEPGMEQTVDEKQRMMRLLPEHPAWLPLTFIRPNPLAVASILGLMADPRWFVDLGDVDGCSKLCETFGLTPNTQRDVAIGELPTREHHRCKLVLNAWKNRKMMKEVRERYEIVTPVPVANVPDSGVGAGDFVWRTWGECAGFGLLPPGRFTIDETLADLTASRRLLHFISGVWLDALYRGSCSLPEQGARLFRPGDFFKHPLEVAEYEKHQVRCGID